MLGVLSLLPGHPVGEIIHRSKRCLCTGDRYHCPHIPSEGTVPIPAHATELGEDRGDSFKISQMLPGLKYKGYQAA